MRFVRFEPEHAFAFEPQGAQRPYMQWFTPEIAAAASQFFSFTGVDEEGVVGCAGLAPADTGELIAWAVFSERIKRHAVSVMRAVKRGLDLHRDHVVVAHVHPEHRKAAAFAEALSFNFKEVRADLHPSGAALHVYLREGGNG